MTQVKMLSIDVMSAPESSGEQNVGKSSAKDGVFGHLVNEQIRHEQSEPRADSRRENPASESHSKSGSSNRAVESESSTRKEGADNHSRTKEDVASAEKQELDEQNKAKAKDEAPSSEGTSSESKSAEGDNSTDNSVIVDADQKNSAKELFDFLNKSNQLLQAEESAENAKSDEIESLASIKLTTSDLSLFKSDVKESLSDIKSAIAENAKVEQGVNLDTRTTKEADSEARASQLDSQLDDTEAELNAEISKFNEGNNKLTSEVSELSKQMAANSAANQAVTGSGKLDSSDAESAESKSAQLQNNKLSQDELKSSITGGVTNSNLSAEEAIDESIEYEALVNDLAEQPSESGKDRKSPTDANITANSAKTNDDLLTQQIERSAQQTSDEKVNLDELSTEEKLVQGIQTNQQVQRSVSGDSKSSTSEYSSQLQNNVAQSSNNADGSPDDAETNADGKTQTESKLVADGQASAANTQTRSSFSETLAATMNNQATSSSPQTIPRDNDSLLQQLEAASARVIESNQSLTKTEQKLQIETINIYRKDFANAVKDKVMVMVNQRLQQVEIQLDPPELGNVHVRLNLQSEQANVSFLVQNQQAKEALEQQMGKLRDMLQESGVDVGDANVAQQQQSQQEGKGHGMAGGFHQDAEDDQLVNANLAQVIKPSATGVDFYA